MAVAKSLANEFEGKAWLLGESSKEPETTSFGKIRIFMLIFNSWHKFKWKNSDLPPFFWLPLRPLCNSRDVKCQQL
jgi:hypothetical protein